MRGLWLEPEAWAKRTSAELDTMRKLKGKKRETEESPGNAVGPVDTGEGWCCCLRRKYRQSFSVSRWCKMLEDNGWVVWNQLQRTEHQLYPHLSVIEKKIGTEERTDTFCFSCLCRFTYRWSQWNQGMSIVPGFLSETWGFFVRTSYINDTWYMG